MRVAMVGLRAPWGVEGGVESAVAEMAPRLAAAGCTVTVYCRGRYNPYGTGMRDGVRLVDTPTVYRRSVEAFAHTAYAAPHAAVHHDLVHLHACGPALFAPVPSLLRRASVVTIHGFDWERAKWGAVARSVLRAGASSAGHGATELIGVSQGITDWFAARYPAPATFIPNGVSPHEHHPWEAGIFPALKPDAYTLFIGRLVPEKDLLTLVRAAARARPRHPVVITGGAAYTDDYVKQLHREASGHVHFTGPRFRREKRMLLSHARAFVFPSRVEGLPIALLEAMSAGLMCVASDIPANREALADHGGWRLPVGDVEAWAKALGELDAAEPAFRRGIGAQGRKRVQEHFSWDAVVQDTLAVYERSLRSRRGANSRAPWSVPFSASR